MELRRTYLAMRCFHLRTYDECFDPSKMTPTQYYSTLMDMDIQQLEFLLNKLSAEKEILHK